MAYIFFDIDGTLWDEKMQIPESTIPTIKQLQKNGHKTFLCSGRSRSNINDKRLLGSVLTELLQHAETMWRWMERFCMKISFPRN